MGEIIIEESNYRAIALVMANLFLFLASIAIAVFGFMKSRISLWFPGLFAIFAFFIRFDIAIRNAKKIKSLITITLDGIIDNSSLSGMGFISFEDIKAFRIVNLYRARVIEIELKSLDDFLLKLPMVKSRQVKRNIYMNQPPVFINVKMAKDMAPEDILSMMNKRLSDYNSLYEYEV